MNIFQLFPEFSHVTNYIVKISRLPQRSSIIAVTHDSHGSDALDGTDSFTEISIVWPEQKMQVVRHYDVTV